LQALFLPAGSGQRLVVCHPAQGPVRGGVVYVPPFAEEMNKARRMATVQAHAFAEAGFSVVIPDLAGCGDSSGDLVEVTWEDWV
jgi:alpha-beta hydrolase superfamily lysophospholipase